jgi:very-short-patch-repair endonuclease
MELSRLNKKPLKYRRRKLRADATQSEIILWDNIRNRKLGLRFVRQFSIDNYVIDFYCPEKRIGIELEGGIHKRRDQIKYDKYREEYIKAFGIRLIKFTNEEVCKQTIMVLEKIKGTLNGNIDY